MAYAKKELRRKFKGSICYLDAYSLDSKKVAALIVEFFFPEIYSEFKPFI
jgi:hypothetical protein